TWWIGAIANQWSGYPELFTDNDVTTGNRFAVGSGPDFVVTQVSTAPSSIPGGPVAVSATLCNQGTLGASAPMVEAFFSSDPVITGSDQLAGPLVPVPGWLEAGACATLTSTLPAPGMPGTYWVGAIADRTNSVVELLEDNNATAGNRIGVGSLPDFVVTA